MGFDRAAVEKALFENVREALEKHRSRRSAQIMRQREAREAREDAWTLAVIDREIHKLEAQGVGSRPHAEYGPRFTHKLREEIRRRDGYRCQLCGAMQEDCGRILSVHHVDYDKLNSDPVNLVLLCARCHGRSNGNRTHWTAYFRKQALNRPEEIGVQTPQ